MHILVLATGFKEYFSRILLEVLFDIVFFNSSTPGSVGRDASAQFSLTINAGDNDSDDGNEDDEADMDNDSVSFLMVPPPPPSTTTETQEKDSATVEELRQTIVLREQQVNSFSCPETISNRLVP